MPKNVATSGILILFTIVFSTFIVYKIEHDYYQNIYTNDVDSTVSLITRKVESVSNVTESTAEFFSLNDHVSQQEFDNFASVIIKNISSKNNISTSIEWVDSDNVIKYVYPLDDEHKQVVGLDMNNYPNRLIPMQKAKKTKSVVFSDPIMFVEGYPGILAYSPIFQDSKYQGQIIVAIGLFNILDLSTKEATAKSENIYLQTEDLYVPFYGNTIYNRFGERILDAEGGLEKDSTAQNYYLKSNKLISKEIIFSDKKWQINFYPTYIAKTYKMGDNERNGMFF